jgi:glucose-6-phosphate isomerase
VVNFFYKHNFDKLKSKQWLSDNYQSKVKRAHSILHKESLNNDFNHYLGWVDLVINYQEKEIDQIKNLVSIWQKKEIEVVVVIGIGGSYIGLKSALEMINGLFPKKSKNNSSLFPEVIYVGQTLSSNYINQVIDYLSNKKFSIIVISKSGTTLEPNINLIIFSNLLKKCDDFSSRVAVITSNNNNYLHKLALTNNYHLFFIPNDIGGRFSILTVVGLLIIALAGIDIYHVILGAKKAYQELLTIDLDENPAYLYAVHRDYFYNQGYQVEFLISYEEQMASFCQWWQQLFAESEGKNDKGLLPTFLIFPRDLHSLGQYLQEGKKIFFQSTIKFEKTDSDLSLKDYNFPFFKKEKLNLSLNDLNDLIFKGVLEAHISRNTPQLVFHFKKMDAENFGYLTYFFMKSCAMSAFLLDINPFDQPGVEIYKRNVFKLLG